MLYQMAPPTVIWTIVGISLVLSIASMIFSKRFKTSQAAQMETQRKMRDLRLKLQQAQNDVQEMYKIQEKIMTMTKDMMKKQMVPMLIRSVVWMGIFGILRLIYDNYTEFLPFDFIFGRSLFDLYLLVSISFSVLSIIARLIYKQLNPEKAEEKKEVVDHLNILDSNILEEQKEDEVGSRNLSNNDSDGGAFSMNKDWKQRLN